VVSIRLNRARIRPMLPPGPDPKVSTQWWRDVIDRNVGKSSPAVRSRAWAVRHPALAFAVLAYTISWICWLPLLADRQGCWPASWRGKASGSGQC
jgi:hypothetical protein